MSSTITPTPSDGLTPTSSVLSSLPGSLPASPAPTEAATNFFKDQKPLESYLYPTLSLIIAILVAVHACRFLERRRLRRRHAAGLDHIDASDDGHVVDERTTAKLARPPMYDVYLDNKEARKIGRDTGWKDIMPLSSNVFVHIEDVKPTTLVPDHSSQRRPWLSEDSRHNASIMVDSIKGAILSGLELLSLYNRRAERELHAQNRRNRNSAILAESHIPEPPLDPNLPRELVTGVMILMPSANRTSSGKHEKWEEEQLPYVAIGIKYKEWKGRIDVDGGPESSVAS